MDRHDTKLANLHRGVPNARRQGQQEHRQELREELEYESEVDEEAIMDAEIGRLRNRGASLERRGRNLVEDKLDGDMGNIKMSIPPFK